MHSRLNKMQVRYFSSATAIYLVGIYRYDKTNLSVPTDTRRNNIITPKRCRNVVLT